MRKSIVIFSEEYCKVTKGLFNVWKTFAISASDEADVTIVLNKEHWAKVEIKDYISSKESITFIPLSFEMPSTWLSRVLNLPNKNFIKKFGIIFNVLFAPVIIFRLTIFLRNKKKDAIYSHNGGWPAGQLCRWILVAAYLAGISKRIIIIHSHPHKIKLSWKLLFPFEAKLVEAFATSIVTVSDSVKTKLESNVFKSKITRIHNAIEMKCSISQSHSSSVCKIGFIGALVEHKGAHILIEAFSFITSPSELHLMGPSGDSKYIHSLNNLAANCFNAVVFHDPQPDSDTFFNQIDILVVPSINFESFGLVILEAMKHKIAVICSDYGGMKEVVEHGKSGYVVKSADPIALAKALEILIKNKNLREEFGQAGFQRLISQFNPEKMTAEYLSLLKDASH